MSMHVLQRKRKIQTLCRIVRYETEKGVSCYKDLGSKTTDAAKAIN